MVYVNFGEYEKQLRMKKNISLTKAAKMLGISMSYLSSLENGNRPSPSNELLLKMVDLLELNSREKNKLFDLAAESKQPPALADDLVEYIYKYPAIRDMLRYSMECDMTEKDWDNVLTFVKKNYFY